MGKSIVHSESNKHSRISILELNIISGPLAIIIQGDFAEQWLYSAAVYFSERLTFHLEKCSLLRKEKLQLSIKNCFPKVSTRPFTHWEIVFSRNFCSTSTSQFRKSAWFAKLQNCFFKQNSNTPLRRIALFKRRIGYWYANKLQNVTIEKWTFLKSHKELPKWTHASNIQRFPFFLVTHLKSRRGEIENMLTEHLFKTSLW